MRWNVSCEIPDENALGNVLAVMKMMGCTDIGFDAARLPTKGAAPPQLAKPRGRPRKEAAGTMTMEEAVAEWVEAQPSGKVFRARDVHDAVKHKMRKPGTEIKMGPFLKSGKVTGGGKGHPYYTIV